DRAHSVEKGAELVQKVLMHHISIPALNKWTTACFGSLPQEDSSESEDPGVAVGQPVDQTRRWRKLARRRQKKSAIFLKDPESQFRTLSWTVLTAPVMRIHFSLFKHSTWLTERKRNPQADESEASSAFGMVAAKPTRRALSAYADMMQSTENDAWLPLAGFYGRVLDWPQARLRTTRRTVCTIIGQLWRKLDEPWQRYPWKLLGLLDSEDTTRRACAAHLLASKRCCLDNFSEKLRETCPSVDQLLSEQTLAFLEAVFDRVVPTSTYVERHYAETMSRLVDSWRKKRIHAGLQARPRRAWSLLSGEEKSRWKQQAKVQNAAARVRRNAERADEVEGQQQDFAGGPWNIGSTEGFPLARHVVADNQHRQQELVKQFKDRTDVLQPDNLDSLEGAPETQYSLFAACGSNACFQSLSERLQAGLENFHKLLVFTILNKGPAPLSATAEPLVLAFKSEHASTTEYFVVAYNTRRSPVEAAMLQVEVDHNEDVPEGISKSLKISLSPGNLFVFFTNRSLCLRLFQVATDWDMYTLDIGPVRKLWHFDVRGEERVEPDGAHREMRASGDVAAAVQALRLMSRKPPKRRNRDTDPARPTKKPKTAKQGEADGALDSKEQPEAEEADEASCSSVGSSCSEREASDCEADVAVSVLASAPAAGSERASSSTDPAPGAAPRERSGALQQRVPRATAWGDAPAFQIAPLFADNVHIGWRATCGRHHDDGTRVWPCRKTINFGSGSARIPDTECILRLKRWLVAGLEDKNWGKCPRSVHISQGGWLLQQFEQGLSEAELDARVGHAAA
ncbi:unnamed protein product, partial [Symbiodinium necroappetens]